jgi:hypothetical protein
MRSTICWAMASLAVLEIGARGLNPGVVLIRAIIREPSYGLRVIGRASGVHPVALPHNSGVVAGTSIAAATARGGILSFMSELVWRVRAAL